MNGFNASMSRAGLLDTSQNRTPTLRGTGLRELADEELLEVGGGNTSMITAGAGMVSASIGMAALGFAALGPLGLMVASGLAFSGGVAIGQGTRSWLQRR